MPVSHKYKCVFIHIPRTGGTSFRELLRTDEEWDNEKELNQEDLLFVQSTNEEAASHTAPRVLHKQHLCLHHMNQLNLITDEVHESYSKIAFVRNPWDKTLSSFANHYQKYCIDFADYVDKIKIIVEFINDHFTYNLESDFYSNYSRITFNALHGRELISPFMPWGNGECVIDPFFWPQHLYTHNYEDDFSLNGLGRFENYEQDANSILQILGITTPIQKTNSSRHELYQDVYTSKTRDIIAGVYAADISRFGYKF